MGTFKASGIEKIAILTLLLFLLTPLSASADVSNTLLKYLPADTKITMGVNLNSMRSSDNYGTLKGFVEGQTPNSQLLSELSKGADGSLDSFNSFAMGLPETPSKKPDKLQKYTLVIKGHFKKKSVSDLISEAKKKKAKDPKVKKQLDNLSIYTPSNGLAVLISGTPKYRAQTKANLKSGKNLGSSKRLKGVMGKIDSSAHIWFAGADPTGRRKIEQLGITLSLKDGLHIDGYGQCTSVAEAKKKTKQLKALRKQGAGNPMLAMFGVGPLLSNLDIKRSKKDIETSSSMSSEEFSQLIKKVQYMMNRTGSMLGNPKGGSAPAPMKSSPGSGSKAPSKSDKK
jgi:hypothetical protein